MSNVIAVVNQKGGTGKTTTAMNLAAGLIRYSDVTSSCLVIDLDPHGCASATMLGKVEGGATQRTIFDVLRRAITPHDGIMSSVFSENIDILPSSPHLESMAKTQIFDRLRKVTEALASSYGWIIVDTPPNLGVLTTNALVASDYVLTPTPVNGLSVTTLRQLNAHINVVRSSQNDLQYDIQLSEFPPNLVSLANETRGLGAAARPRCRGSEDVRRRAEHRKQREC